MAGVIGIVRGQDPSIGRYFVVQVFNDDMQHWLTQMELNGATTGDLVELRFEQGRSRSVWVVDKVLTIVGSADQAPSGYNHSESLAWAMGFNAGAAAFRRMIGLE